MEKKDILSYYELREKALSLNKSSIDDYIKAFTFYDVEPTMNLNYINLLDKEKQPLEFIRLMYTLNLNKRIELIDKFRDYENKYKERNHLCEINLFQKRCTEQIFKDILKLFIDSKTTIEIFEKSLNSYNYIPSQNFKCSYYEGNEEFFYAGLIESFKHYILNLKENPRENDIDYEEFNNYNSFSFSNLDKYILIKNTNFINKSQAIKIEKNQINEAKKIGEEVDIKLDERDENLNNEENKESEKEKNTEQKMECYNDKINIKKDEKEKLIKKIFNNKKMLLQNLIEKYISNEFSIKLFQLYNKIENEKFKIRLKRIYPIYLLHTLIMYAGFKINNSKVLRKSYDMFYEYEKDKIKIINNLIKYEQIKLYDGDTILNNLFTIDNKKYTIKIQEKEISINFFDYIITNFDNSDFDTITNLEKKLIKKENWTLQKFIKENSLFSNPNISKITEENIFESIKNNKTLEKAFYEVEIFNKYNYPFNNNKIIEQIKQSLFIFPFTCESISGLTLKYFGIILVNNHIKNLEKNLDKEDYFFCFLLKGMMYKVVYIHEINFHYVFHLIYANNYSKEIKIPEKLFISYKVEQGDSGDKGECLLFGKKVNYIFIKAAILLSNDNEFKLNDNEEFNIISEKFLSYNRSNALGELNNFYLLVNKSEYCKKLYDLVDKEINFIKRKKKPKKDFDNYFCISDIKEDIFIEEKIPLGERFIIGGKCFPLNEC